MALGDQAGLQAVEAAKAALPGLEEFLRGREDQLAAIVNSVIAAEQALVPQLQSAIAADLGPLIEESKAWRQLIESGLEGTVNGNIPFTIQGKAQAK